MINPVEFDKTLRKYSKNMASQLKKLNLDFDKEMASQLK